MKVMNTHNGLLALRHFHLTAQHIMLKTNEDNVRSQHVVRHVDLTKSSGNDDDENHDDRRRVDLTNIAAEEELERSTSPVTIPIDFSALYLEREARQAAKLLACSLQGQAAGEPHFSSSFLFTSSFQNSTVSRNAAAKTGNGTVDKEEMPDLAQMFEEQDGSKNESHMTPKDSKDTVKNMTPKDSKDT
jgi:hypothetical protein